jgi:acetyl esterase/lipase
MPDKSKPILNIDPRLFSPEAVSEETRAFNERTEALTLEEPPVYEVSPEESRRVREAGTARTGPVVLSPAAITRSIPGPGGDIPLRVFLSEEMRGVYLHIHGGGWVLGRAHLQDPYLENLAREAKCAVVSVDYRLAPEHPYPAGIDDCAATALWLLKNARKEFGLNRFVIGGESSGAHLAAAVLSRLKKAHGSTGFAGANLVYGIFDLSGTPSLVNWGERRLVLNTPAMQWFIDQFAPAENRRDPDVSPLYADLSGMPPALFTVGTLDCLLDDSLFMAARWASFGNSAELAVYPGGLHGFSTTEAPLAKRSVAKMTEFMLALWNREG